MRQKTPRKQRWGEAGPGRPKGRRNLSPVERARIAGKRMAGESLERIAKEEGVTKQTVIRVLSRAEFQALQSAYRSKAMEAVPDSLAYLHRRVKQGLRAGAGKDVPGATQAAVKILEGMQILVPRQQVDLAGETTVRFGPYGYSAYGDKSDEELEFMLREERWPTASELEHHRKTGRWPEVVEAKK